MADLRCRELDGQRQAVHEVDDRVDRGMVRRGIERGTHRRCALGEHPEGRIRIQGQDLPFLLARDPKRCAAGHEDAEARGCLEQPRYQGRCGEHLLEVVEHQQQPAVSQIGLDGRHEVDPRTLCDPERVGDPDDDGVDLMGVLESDERRTV